VITVRLDDPTSPEAAQLIARHTAGMGLTTPAEHRFVLGANALNHPDTAFFTAWDGDQLAGMGAIKDLGDGHAEIKSMRTDPAHLRKGVGAAVLTALIDAGRARGFQRLSLETGTSDDFVPAHALYRRFGFADCSAFADYPADSPHNCYMTLHL
jgi:putative acetyltransferase